MEGVCDGVCSGVCGRVCVVGCMVECVVRGCVVRGCGGVCEKGEGVWLWSVRCVEVQLYIPP